MKKWYLFISMLAIAALFTFCTKDNPPAGLETKPAGPAPAVADRVTCDLTVTTTGDIGICGLQNNTTTCQSCCGVPLTGVTAVSGNAIIPVNTAGSVVFFFIRNVSGGAITVRLTAGSNLLQYDLAAGQCIGANISNFCWVGEITNFC